MSVVYFMQHPKIDGAWLCEVLPVGTFTRGVMVKPGRTQCSGYGHRNTKWFTVYPSGRQGWHPVTLGKDVPENEWVDQIYAIRG